VIEKSMKFHGETEPLPERWRCAECGREFDTPTTSHPRHHHNCDGSQCDGQCPVECGPVERYSAPIETEGDSGTLAERFKDWAAALNFLQPSLGYAVHRWEEFEGLITEAQSAADSLKRVEGELAEAREQLNERERLGSASIANTAKLVAERDEARDRIAKLDSALVAESEAHADERGRLRAELTAERDRLHGVLNGVFAALLVRIERCQLASGLLPQECGYPATYAFPLPNGGRAYRCDKHGVRIKDREELPYAPALRAALAFLSARAGKREEQG